MDILEGRVKALEDASFRDTVLHHLASLGLTEGVIRSIVDLHNSSLGQSKHSSEE